MKLSKLKAIVRKDLLEVSKNKSALIPSLIVPLLFIVVLPIGLTIGARYMGSAMLDDPDIALFVKNLPPVMSRPLQGATAVQQILLLFFSYFMAPMFMIFPIMFSTIIAAESFAGERERKTLEALLYTPTTDQELFTGKLLAGFLAAIALTWGMFAVYTVVLNALGWQDYGRLWFPSTAWLVLIFWVAPAFSLVAIAATVFISARSKSFMEAYQNSGVLVMLAVALLSGQLTGVLYLTAGVSFLIGLVMMLIGVFLVWKAAQTFTRPRLIGLK